MPTTNDDALELPGFFTPMLATTVPEPFDSDDHLFEVKWDGVRALVFCEAGATKIYARSGRDVTHQYPEFASVHELVEGPAVLDGEIVALDAAARPSFELLQNRIAASKPADVRRGLENIPLDLIVFDIVFTKGRWVGSEKLVDRLDMLQDSVRFEGRVQRSQTIPQEGVALFEAAKERGLEGTVGKKVDSVYIPGRRTRDWSKTKVVHSIDVVIGGWSVGTGGRGSSFGAVHVGLFGREGLRYIGSVGTGFTDRALAELRARLQDLEQEESSFTERIPGKGHRWTRPELVCTVEYREMTSAVRMRAPSFKGLRSDKDPGQCTLDEG